MTKPGATTGQYYVDYTLDSGAAIEGLVFKVDATEGAITTQYAASAQVVDTTAVVLITFWASIFSGEMTVSVILTLIVSGYSFKLLIALADTIPFYIGSHYMKKYLQIDPMSEHDIDDEETTQPRRA